MTEYKIAPYQACCVDNGQFYSVHPGVLKRSGSNEKYSLDIGLVCHNIVPYQKGLALLFDVLFSNHRAYP